ncbi:hypothetical protein H671_1g2412 [Cricetulus griseus]|uniref:Uncharacterized protein n=1 Tax=Cricetulus griseus TaxID=10029 RepID=A0A061IJM6_CRIGR|nr:hypothetical protein H671_1g2412 [Cricetulus griseus]
MVDYIDEFSYVEPSLHPWDEAYLIIVDDFSDVFLDSICQYFIENFCISVYEGYWSFVYMVNYINKFSYMEPTLHLWNGAYLIMVDDLFDVNLNSIDNYFIEYYYINVH